LRHKKESTTERYLQMIHTDLSDLAGLARPKVHEEGTQKSKGVNDKNR